MFGDEDTYVKPSQINEDTDDYDRVYARMRALRVKMNQDLEGQKWYDPVPVSNDKKLPEVKKTPIIDTNYEDKNNYSCDECQKMRSQLELIKTTLLNLANCIDLPPEKLPPTEVIAEKNMITPTIDEIPLPKYTHEELIAKKYVDISGCNIIEMSSDDLLS